MGKVDRYTVIGFRACVVAFDNDDGTTSECHVPPGGQVYASWLGTRHDSALRRLVQMGMLTPAGTVDEGDVPARPDIDEHHPDRRKTPSGEPAEIPNPGDGDDGGGDTDAGPDGAAPAAGDDEEYADYPDEGTVEDVLAWVGTDPDRAEFALDVESDREHPRKTVLEPLEALLAPPA